MIARAALREFARARSRPTQGTPGARLPGRGGDCCFSSSSRTTAGCRLPPPDAAPSWSFFAVRRSDRILEALRDTRSSAERAGVARHGPVAGLFRQVIRTRLPLTRSASDETRSAETPRLACTRRQVRFRPGSAVFWSSTTRTTSPCSLPALICTPLRERYIDRAGAELGRLLDAGDSPLHLAVHAGVRSDCRTAGRKVPDGAQRKLACGACRGELVGEGRAAPCDRRKPGHRRSHHRGLGRHQTALARLQSAGGSAKARPPPESRAHRLPLRPHANPTSKPLPSSMGSRIKSRRTSTSRRKRCRLS